MLDLKAKLLAAGLVTAEQVKKVEDEAVAKKERDKARREQSFRQTKDGPARKERRERPAHHDDDPDEKRARRENQWEEAERWRKRLDALKAAPKAEQYDTLRGWVLKNRLDHRIQISEQAKRFHFHKTDGAISHVTVEPELHARVTEGTAAIVAFLGYNGIEHAVVEDALGRDIGAVKPEWLRHLLGVTDAPGADAGPVGAAEIPVDAEAAPAPSDTDATPADAQRPEPSAGAEPSASSAAPEE